MFKILIFICVLWNTLGFASFLDKNGIVRHSNGQVYEMSQYEAQHACPKGTHLPTARDLALEAIALGAKGILEKTSVAKDQVPAGYTLIKALNSDGTTDYFYYNGQGYKRPKGDLGDRWFWSSSQLDEFITLAFFLYGDNGIIDTGEHVVFYGYYPGFNRGDNNAVRCLKNRK